MVVCCLRSPCRRGVLVVTSLLSILTGAVLLTTTDWLFSQAVQSQLVVREGSASYNAWKETPIPVYTKFYFFDMVNPRELFYSKEMPILVEKGPYTFREVEKKVNITWHNNGTVSYRRVKHWFFEPSMSVGPLTDTVTTINVPVVGSAEFARGDYFKEWGISDMLATVQATIFVKRTIGQLLFEGYADTVMEIGAAFTGEEEEQDEGGGQDEYGEDDFEDDFFGEQEESEEVKEEIAEVESTEMKVPMDKFGWFYKRNGTSWSDGELLMSTGVEELEQLGRIQAWNRQTTTDAYTGKCGEVRGSADGLFPPGLALDTDTITIYSTDLCRPLSFVRHSSHSVHGVPVVRFQLAGDSFANSTVCPGNHCYGNNLPTGVQNVTQCKVKSPAFVSRPHFHLADQFYSDQFQYGIQPDPSLHESSFWLEPHSSIPVRVEMRLQLNILLEKVPGIEYLFKDLQKVMFPVMWFDSVAAVPEDMAGSLYLLVSLPVMFQTSGVLTVVFGVLLLLFYLVDRLKAHRTGEKDPVTPLTGPSLATTVTIVRRPSGATTTSIGGRPFGAPAGPAYSAAYHLVAQDSRDLQEAGSTQTSG